MATTTNEDCPIRSCSLFTSQPTAIKSFSSSFFAIFENSHQLLQSRSMDLPPRRLSRGPTQEFACKGDHLHRLTTLNSLPHGCCAILFGRRDIQRGYHD